MTVLDTIGRTRLIPLQHMVPENERQDSGQAGIRKPDREA